MEIITGPEILTGLIRLKSGTAQKLVLNMISTISMVKIGKAYENLMVDVVATRVFDKAGSVKLAIVMILSGASKEDYERILTEMNGFVREFIQRLVM